MKGHIRRRGKRSWALVLDIGLDSDGKRRQKWHSVQGTKREAERELTRLLHDLNTGGYVEPSNLTVRDYLDKWLKDCARPTVAPKTFERYAEIVGLHLIPALGHHPLSKLHPLHIQAHYSEALMNGRRKGIGGLSPQTVLHHHRVLHKALQQAVRWQLLARNPAAAAEPPRPQRKQVKALDEADIGKVLDALQGSRLRAPALMALASGVRRGELLALRWRDMSLEQGTMVVRHALQQTKEGVAFKSPKSGRGRTVALPNMAVEALRAQKASQAEERLSLGAAYHDDDLVFPLPDGRPWPPDSFTSAFQAQMRKAKMPNVNFHCLRHSHATLLLKQGVNAKVVSERLGHANVGTTLDIYAHVLPGMQEEAARRIDASLRAALGTTS